MTVPKVACTTIKMALQTWEGCGPPPERWGDVHASWAGPTLLAYPTAQIVEMLRSPDYLRFSLVRNPYGRLVSAWKSKLAWADPQYRQLEVEHSVEIASLSHLRLAPADARNSREGRILNLPP